MEERTKHCTAKCHVTLFSLGERHDEWLMSGLRLPVVQ